jgi:hypothetical protein
MRFDQIKPTQQLDEVRMGQSDLDGFVKSQDAQGIKAGFEAELCFKGKGFDEDSYETEEDYDNDERPDDIDEICNFFNDGDYNSRSDIRGLREAMQESFFEWRGEKMDEAWYRVMNDNVREYIEENDYTEEDEIKNYLSDNLGLEDERVEEILASGPEDKEAYALLEEATQHARDVLDELVESAIDNQDRSYESAYEEWRDYNEDDYSERDWLSDIGVRYMSDVVNEFHGHVTWPHWSRPEQEDGFNEGEAEELARSLRHALDVNVKVGSGYHSVQRKPGLWIIEADSSLEAESGDMPAEIISPPMPLGECLEKMAAFFEWADGESAYGNESTGLHVGVSLPYVEGRIDYIKLALFLGDKYVLSEFDRASNYYCKSAFEKIKDGVNDSNVESTFELLRKGLIELAGKTLKQNGGHGKYTSINLKNNYVEFRSMGGEYHEKVPEVLNMVKRYAYAMHIASRPDLERDEYAKKLYKMLSKSNSDDGTAVHLFSRYASKTMSRDTLMNFLKSRNKNREATKANTEINGSQAWTVINRSSNQPVRQFLAKDEADAKTKHEAWLLAKGLNGMAYSLVKSDTEDAPQKQTPQRYEIYRRSSDEALRHGGPTSEVLAFLANSQEDAESKLDRYCRDYALGAPQLFGVRPLQAVRQNDIPPGTQARGGFTGQWKVIDTTGREVYRFGGVGNSQQDANTTAARWLTQAMPGSRISEFTVLPVMGNQ